MPKPNVEAILAWLGEGNARFVRGHLQFAGVDHDRRDLAANADQKDHALATVVACSDSRVPVETIFDARLMDLFVVRVAGGVVRRAQTASIEYGLLHVHTPLLVILGHTDCGAVKAAIQQAALEAPPAKDNVTQLVDGIAPAVERALSACPDASPQALVRQAVVENVWQSIGDLFCSSPVVCQLVGEGRVTVVGAMYDLATGQVDWLDDAKVHQILQQAEETRSSLLAPWDEKSCEDDPYRAHVLVVDDERDFLDNLVERLRVRGFQADAAESGLQALDRLRAQHYDAIILDLGMPDLDGMETLRRALARDGDLQIILLTGQATVSLGVQAIKLGAMDFIEKPANIDVLVEKIMEGKGRRMECDAAARELALRELTERHGW